MTSSPAPDLEELERLAKAATPGPWRVGGDFVTGPSITPGYEHAQTIVASTEPDAEGKADAAYIVALVNAAAALITELRAARGSQTSLAPPVGISPVETAGHSSPDLEPRTEAGRRFLEDLTKEHCSDPHGCHAADDSLAGMAVLAIEAEAAAESGRLREALTLRPAGTVGPEKIPWFEHSGVSHAAGAECYVCALLATPPAPSDHGASGSET